MAFKIKKKKDKEKLITPELRIFISKMDAPTKKRWIEGLKPSQRKQFLKEWFAN